MAYRQSQCAAILASIDPALHEESFGMMLRQNVQVSMTKPSNRQSSLTPEKLARTWKISLRRAQNTLRATTQRATMTLANPAISRRFKTNDRSLRYKRIPYDIYTDTLKATIKSRRGNLYSQIYATDFGWSRNYSMRQKSDAHQTLSELFRIGVPVKMIMDGSKEQCKGDFRRKLREADCKIKQTEKDSQFSNSAEREIREIKKGAGIKMTAKKSPKKLWDHCLELESLIRSHTALDIHRLQGQVPETMITGHTADISRLYEFEWYEWIKFYESAARFPDDKMILARYLGPAIDVGPHLTGKFLKYNGQEAYGSTYRKLTEEEWISADDINERDRFDDNIRKVLGPEATGDDFEKWDAVTHEVEYYSDEKTHPELTPDRDEYQNFDKYIGADVVLPFDDQNITGHVKARVRLRDGTLKGTPHPNKLFDTSAYVVEFPDGREAEYTANIIAQNLLSQCNLDGAEHQLIQGFKGHKTDDSALVQENCRVTDKAGKQHTIKTTKGWMLLTDFIDGTTSWARLADLKESNPIEVAEYAVANGIDKEPAFS